MGTRSAESQPYPGLHEKNHGQQVERRDSAPVLCSGETLPGVLYPALEPLATQVENDSSASICLSHALRLYNTRN